MKPLRSPLRSNSTGPWKRTGVSVKLTQVKQLALEHKWVNKRARAHKLVSKRYGYFCFCPFCPKSAFLKLGPLYPFCYINLRHVEVEIARIQINTKGVLNLEGTQRVTTNRFRRCSDENLKVSNPMPIQYRYHFARCTTLCLFVQFWSWPLSCLTDHFCVL